MTRDDWQLLLNEASQLHRAGRVEQAIAAYERLLAAKPDLADSWYNLGWLQRQDRRFEDALASYGRALDLNVTEPEEIHVNRAVIYSDQLHSPAEAERELRAALAKNPSYVPALLNLGNLMEDLGERAQARSAYEDILAIEPQHSLALARLAGVSHSESLDAGLANQLGAAIARPTNTAAERADLGFALAGLLDAAGQYDEAFDAAAAANAASRAAAEVHYDRAGHERFVDRLIATFDPAVLPSGVQRPSPIFICGMFRSGSTLLEQILGAHSLVRTCGELDLIPALISRIPDYPGSVKEADAATIARWRSFYLDGLPAPPSHDRLVTDKRPDNFLHIGLTKILFPNAKIIHTRRNPLDNLLSLYFLHLDPGMAYALDLEDAAHWYGEHLRLMAHWKTLYPDDIFDVNYDELVREPQPMIERLLSFCGLEWEDNVLDFHRGRSVVKTASLWQVRQPLHARSSGRWVNYERHLRDLDDFFSGGRE
ncbi:MAG TPA: sulfotransferase [Sphingomicrobium sp.]|nr:sulfotransferase [Sphingomicrobium sp.]